MQYLLLHTMGDDVELDQARQPADEVVALAAWLERAIGQKVDLHGSRLRPAGDATTLRWRHGDLVVTDGPFAETKEQIAGYDLLACGDLEEAVGWAEAHPTAVRGAIEVRALADEPPVQPLPEPGAGKTRYMLLVCVDPAVALAPGEVAEVGPRTDAWVAEHDASGARLFGSRLEEPGQAKTVRLRAGGAVVSDGPFTETKEWVAGFDLVECQDLDEAITIAAAHPVTRFGSIEVRPLWPFD
jgi:hypothetical protein